MNAGQPLQIGDQANNTDFLTRKDIINSAKSVLLNEDMKIR
jgi:hypothetical protein